MLSFHNVQKRFSKLHVLKGIDLELPGSQTVAIIGPNGSGKTTLLKSLLGQVIPDAGEIRLDSTNIIGRSEYRRNLGYMAQISRFPENIRIKELIEMMQDLRGDVKDYDTDLLEAYNLEAIAGKRLGTLSGGTKQKVGSALAFMFNPKLLILDEPTAGLDPVATEILKAKIRQEKEKGKLILITSHIMSDIEELADTIVYILEGNIQFSWPVNRVKEYTGETSFSKAMAKIVEVQYA
jgi:Cu-processing system ATP-binding protein